MARINTRAVLACALLMLGASSVVQAKEQTKDKDRIEQRQPDKDSREDAKGKETDQDREDDDRNPKVTVALTAPVSGTVVTAPANVTLSADAQSRQKNHPIAKVEFYNGGTLLGTATRAPYTFSWSAVPAGTYSLTAKAYADKGQKRDERDKDEKQDVALSAPVTLIVNAPPSVSLTGLANNTIIAAPGTLTLSANASDSDGTVAKVEFYQGATLIGTATSAPYSITWNNIPAGRYTLTAQATDNQGASTVSTAATLIADTPPTVSLTSPAPNQTVAAPGSVTVSANATDSDGIAKVEFYAGTTLIGSASTAPYMITWSNVPSGNYVLTAKAIDTLGIATTSSAVTVSLDTPPSISLTAPTPNQVVQAPGSLTLTASANDSDGSIAKVEFYNGSTLIGTATTAPYSVTWNNIPAGSYTLTAVATDDRGIATTSSPIPVIVNALPTVSLTAPANNAVIAAPGNVMLTASATDSDGTIAKVEYYNGTTLIGTATTAPYSFTWNTVPAGSYTITAVATDDRGGQGRSSPVTVILDAPPTVTLASPGNNAVIAAPANLTLTASASSSGSSIAKVDYYNGTTLIGTATSAPYSVTWANVPSGSYTLTAIATDALGISTTSSPVQVSVDTPPTITLTSPSPNQVIAAPGNVTLTANAADSDGSIAKVEFYQGTTLLGTSTTPPYSFTWNGVPAGSYTLTAVATDNLGLATTSTPIAITLDAPPTVSLTSPASNQVLPTGSVTLTANATSSGNSIAKVEFYNGATLIGTATTAPYMVTWTSAPSGRYTVTAIATDSLGIATTSVPIQIVVDAPPSITLSSPNAGAVGIAPAIFTLTANATDSDGTIAKVEFYSGATLIGTATAAPYSFAWGNVQPGNYSLTAKATDELGLATTSAAINVSVIANSPPTVNLTSPTQGQSFKAPATITLTASASDPDNNLAKVEFFQNGTLIQTVLSAPYSATWSNVPQGTYAITATATDALGAQTTTAPISITVAPAQASVYYIQADHLGTPRLITDESNSIVWRNLPTTEPFGNSPPEEDPNGTGTNFQFNLRFPGQYADRESNTNYNYFRDYDPSTGRYVQSDPIGLAGGSYSTYLYVAANPLGYIDPFGLDLTPAQQDAVRDAANDWSQSKVPYVYGGASKKGADCSGSVSSIYKQAGIDIGRMTSQGFKNSPLFSPVKGAPQVGDVGVYPGHVVIYGGDATGGQGRDVWSASHTGGPSFGTADSSWYGKPTWYRYK